MKIKISAIIFCTILASACIKTKVKGYTDNAYQGRQVHSIAIHTMDASFTFTEIVEKIFIKQLTPRGVRVIPYYEILPPTRSYTVEERRAALEAARVEAVLIFSFGYSQSSETLIGMYGTSNSYTTGSATANSYGNTTYINGSTNTQTNSFAVPITAINRSTGGYATLWDWRAAAAIWTGNFATSSGGWAYAGDSTHAKSAAVSVLDDLVRRNHFSIPVK